VYVSAVIESLRWPTKRPISAHARPCRCSSEIRRCLRSCGVAGPDRSSTTGRAALTGLWPATADRRAPLRSRGTRLLGFAPTVVAHSPPSPSTADADTGQRWRAAVQDQLRRLPAYRPAAGLPVDEDALAGFALGSRRPIATRQGRQTALDIGQITHPSESADPTGPDAFRQPFTTCVGNSSRSRAGRARLALRPAPHAPRSRAARRHTRSHEN
jgi:hypothetical protein